MALAELLTWQVLEIKKVQGRWVNRMFHLDGAGVVQDGRQVERHVDEAGNLQQTKDVGGRQKMLMLGRRC